MIAGSSRNRGQPLVVLSAVLGGWVLMRVAMWATSGHSPPPRVAAQIDRRESLAGPVGPAAAAAVPDPRSVSPALAPAGPPLVGIAPVRAPVPPPVPPPVASPAPASLPITGYGLVGPQRDAGRPAPSPAPPSSPPPAVLPPSRPRWSADGWLLLRQDSVTPLLSGRPSYGRSQVGAVLRYRLGSRSGANPQLHLRGSAALHGAAQQELAAGFSARPLPGLPLRVVAEARLKQIDSTLRLRPAVFAVSELPAVALVPGLVAEAYGQAGYVGGHYATAFVDGQARIERQLTRIGGLDLRAGAGAWGGAQRDAARLDLGPTASLLVPLGPVQARLALDYRVRVAGRAEPSSGPALTLSAGL
jgi:hypothetical protein